MPKVENNYSKGMSGKPGDVVVYCKNRGEVVDYHLVPMVNSPVHMPQRCGIPEGASRN